MMNLMNPNCLINNSGQETTHLHTQLNISSLGDILLAHVCLCVAGNVQAREVFPLLDISNNFYCPSLSHHWRLITRDVTCECEASTTLNFDSSMMKQDAQDLMNMKYLPIRDICQASDDPDTAL